MADKGNSPSPVSIPPVITLDRPSVSPQTLSPTLPFTKSASNPMFETQAMSSQTQPTAAAPSSSALLSSSSTSSSPQMPTTAKKALDINSLMSPPEPVTLDSFSHHGHTPSTSYPQPLSKALPDNGPMRMMGPQAPMSPPVSPLNKAEAMAPAAVVGPPTPSSGPVKDPILYPPQDHTPSPPQRPLFEPMDVDDHDRLVDAHIASRRTELFRRVSPPRQQEYELTLYFKAQMMDKCMSDHRGWLKRNRDQLLADRRAVAKARKGRLPTLLPASRPSAPTTASLQPAKASRGPRPDKVTKAASTTKISPLSSTSLSSTSPPRPMRTHPAPPRAPPGRISATPEPRRIVAPNREDKKFFELPDYCPPVHSLPNRPNCLKVDWKGSPIDLTGDPHAKLLHPDEVSLAANLRLDCATYLTSKRRIFMRRLECANVGKEFRKTDAQQACKIDVNKASKLWTAFEKVGWLDMHWMKAFMI